MPVKADKKAVSILLTKGEYSTLQEFKEEEGIVMDTEAVKELLKESLMRFKLKKEIA